MREAFSVAGIMARATPRSLLGSADMSRCAAGRVLSLARRKGGPSRNHEDRAAVLMSRLRAVDDLTACACLTVPVHRAVCWRRTRSDRHGAVRAPRGRKTGHWIWHAFAAAGLADWEMSQTTLSPTPRGALLLRDPLLRAAAHGRAGRWTSCARAALRQLMGCRSIC
jgi:hypothetical protein